MQTIEAIDDHIRMLAEWGGQDRIVFIHNRVLEQLAGKTMNRAASERYVERNAGMIIALAKQQARIAPNGINKIIVIDEVAD